MVTTQVMINLGIAVSAGIIVLGSYAFYTNKLKQAKQKAKEK